MDAHLYWHQRPTDSLVAPHNITPLYHQIPPRYFPNQGYPNAHPAPTDPQRFFRPPQIQPPTPQPSRSRVPHPERFLGASCQWVFCNSSRRTPMLARISITDWQGRALIDTFVRPTQPVTDYRSSETGLRSHHLHNAPKIEEVRKSVKDLLQGKVVVGYKLWELFLFLGLSHPAIDTRDVASFVPFRKSLGYKSSETVPLKILINKFMGRDIGHGYEHPLEIARACLDLFRSQTLWEDLVQQGQWPCTTLDDVPEIAQACFT